ncbi:PD-(D/E)XK nuclease family protein [Pseudarthrobacter sp. P1]|uniref:PD-(D/E)XK nuclease family protein n=1 Tax=Pseudarthrobacter sp. P1 TaxID=3418418 RepID=UPI003CEC8E5B
MKSEAPSFADSVEQFEGLDRPVVMFVISRTYSLESSAEELYDATRGNWRISAAARDAAKFAFGIADGLIRTAYVIDSWGQSTEVDAPHGVVYEKPRAFFQGHETDETRSWLGKSVRHLAPAQGAANPVRLFLDGIPSTEPEGVGAYAAVMANEPLARIMYGDKELFHSNLIAWIFETFPQEADQVFGRFVGAGLGAERMVERERQNMDLVMHWPGKAPLVIENKVFAVPGRAQLEGYAEKASAWAEKPGAMLLLSPTRSSFLRDGFVTTSAGADGEQLVWQHLSFETLAESLELAFDGKAPSYEVETVLRYATVLKALAALVDSTRVSRTDEAVFALDESLGELLSKQTLNNLKKARAERVAEAVDQALQGAGFVTGDTCSVFSRTFPAVSSFVVVAVSGEKFRAGWQYQEGAFRLALILDNLTGKGAAAKARRAEFAASLPGLFDFTVLDEVLDSAGTSSAPKDKGQPGGAFNHFDPAFVYRYKKLPDLTVQQLIDAAILSYRQIGRSAWG